jgi:hypothetical protein
MGGHVFTPDGQSVTEMAYPESRSDPFGPPSIDGNGQVIFTTHLWPVFDYLGNLERLLGNSGWTPGPFQAAARGPESVDRLYINASSNVIGLVSLSNVGDSLGMNIGQQKLKDWPPVGSGLAIDGLGRTYFTAIGLYAVSPVYSYSLSPYMKRFSLWSYHRETNRMTAPVIGENGWLYLGYGTDIMALGD